MPCGGCAALRNQNSLQEKPSLMQFLKPVPKPVQKTGGQFALQATRKPSMNVNSFKPYTIPSAVRIRSSKRMF